MKFVLFFICSLLIGLLAKGQLHADFSADIKEGCAPVVVQFTDLSSGNPTSWLWDFGNGSSPVSLKNPGTIYFNPGTYNVKLVIKNAAGADSIVKNKFITVNAQPTIDFNVSDTAGCSPLRVKFTDKSIAGTGSISLYRWDFGDGTTSTDQSPVHDYNLQGDFTVNLRVTNSSGCSRLLTKVNTIHVAEKPKANFTSSSSSNCSVPVLVNFANTSSGAGIRTSNWDFGDGATSNNTSPGHNFTRPGSYNIRLIVTNLFGCKDTVVRSIVVGSAKADFSAPVSICQGTAASFANTSTPAVLSSLWTFGDGESSTDVNVSKIYTTPGTFTVKLVADFGGCRDSVSKRINVLSKPSAEFTASDPTGSCSAPLSVAFSATSSSAIKYLWNFGDGDSSSSVNATHVYRNNGTYAVTLITTGTNGCSDTIRKTDYVTISPVRILGFKNLPYSGCYPYKHEFSANISSPEPIVTYLWNFGDGTTSADSTPVHNYATPGSYNISLKVFTASGCSDSITLPNLIVLSEKPVAKFSALPRVSCANEMVQFLDESTGTISQWRWEFGDGGISAEKSPLYHYFDTGYFTVKLFVTNNNCTDSVSLSNYIFIRPPIAKFDLQFSCDQPLFRTFVNKSIDAKTFFWSFGDGNTSTDSTPAHTYATPGTYPVKLRVENSSCFDEFNDTILVIDEHPNFSVNNNQNCKHSKIVFTATNITASNIASYFWKWGDSTSFTSDVPMVEHTYDSIGFFNPSLVITDKLGCTRTVTNGININIYGPTPAFSSPAGSCVNTSVSFNDESKPYTGHPITSWIINYGDGTIDSSKNTPSFNHTYDTAGVYTVTLIVTDNFGCRDSIQRAITITDPVAAFLLSDSVFCNNSTINFVNNSSGINLSSAWNFGDGSFATASNPVHSYAAEGTYVVSLRVTDIYGCSDSIAKPTGILIRNAKANFELSNSVIICPPAQISFSNKSSYFTAIKWDFDDGNNSNVDSPVHYFQNAGTYNIKLIAYGHGSCADSLVKQVTVLGPSGSFTYSNEFKCAPGTVTFNGRAVNNNDNFIWDFGDGSTISTTSATISHTYTTIGKFLPKLLLRDTALNCTVSIFGSDTLTIAGATSYIRNLGKQFCDTAGIQFFDSSIARFDVISSYLWKFGDGTTSTLQNPYHSYSSPGVFPVSLVVTTNAGCVDSTGSTSVNVIKGPQLQLTGANSICLNQAASFGANLAEPYSTALTWNWNFKNGNTSNAQVPPPQSYNVAGSYIVSAIVTSTNGCSDRDSVVLQVKPLPPVNAGIDSIICLGQSITLKPTGALTYVWEPDATLSCTNCTNPVGSPVSSVKYMVTGTSAEACQNKDTITVTVVQPFSITAISTDTICVGEGARLWVTGADNYNWLPATGLSNANIANPIARPSATTVYTVVGHDYRNCFADTASIPVVVYPIPVFNITQENVSIAVGNSVQVNTNNSSDIISWRWLPAAGLSCANCPQPTASPVTTTTYTAIAANKGGCTARDQVTVSVFCNNGNVFVPNTFSPNNDGVNDVFFPRGKGIAGIKILQIFNRWGTLVFQKTNFPVNDQQFGWDGTFDGHPVGSDVFIFKMEVICSNNEVFPLNGNVSLIR